MDKVKVAISKVNIISEYYQKQTSWWIYVFGSKLRTKNDWDAVGIVNVWGIIRKG